MEGPRGGAARGSGAVVALAVVGVVLLGAVALWPERGDEADAARTKPAKVAPSEPSVAKIPKADPRTVRGYQGPDGWMLVRGDICGLLTPEEVARILPVEQVEVSKTGWDSFEAGSCEFVQNSTDLNGVRQRYGTPLQIDLYEPKAGTITQQMRAKVDQGRRIGSPGVCDEAQKCYRLVQVPGLGDRAYLLEEHHGLVDANARQVKVDDPWTGVALGVSVNGHFVVFTANQTRADLLELARLWLSRYPKSYTVVPPTPCGRVAC